MSDTPMFALLETMIAAVKERERNFTAYRMAFELFTRQYPQHRATVDAYVEQSKQSPALADLMRQKYDEPLEKLRQEDAESLTVEQALKLFRAMKPTDFLN